MFRPLKGEVADQQRFLEDILVQGFDGVVISPINPDAMTELFARVAAKMPLVTTDSDAPKSARKVYVGTNNVEAGKLAGNTAAAALKAAGVTKGKVALFVGRMDMQNAIERKQGIDETLGKVPGIEILPVFLDHADRALAKKNVEDALARYPDLVLAMGIWSYNGPCMADAVRASSREGQADPGRLRRGRRDAEGGPRRAHQRHHRAAAVPVRLPVGQGAERAARRQDASAVRRHRHPGGRQEEPGPVLERAARAEEVIEVCPSR